MSQMAQPLTTLKDPVKDLIKATSRLDLSESLTTPELRALAAEARALAAGAEHALAASFSIPPQFAPQLVMAWLPLSDLASALRLSSAWYEASEPAYEMISRRPGHCHERARAHHNKCLDKLIKEGAGPSWSPREPTTTDYRVGDVVWLEPLKDEDWDIPEARFRITDVFDDCVGGYSLEGPLVGEYGEPPKDTITAVAGVPWRLIVQISLILRESDAREQRTRRVPVAQRQHNDRVGQTVLQLAQRNNAEALQVLLDAGADPSFANSLGQTPLHIAALWGNEGALSVLIAEGANLNARNYNGQTPLHVLAASEKPLVGRTYCALLLLQAGADAGAIDAWEQAPFKKIADDAEGKLGDLRRILLRAARATGIPYSSEPPDSD